MIEVSADAFVSPGMETPGSAKPTSVGDKNAAVAKGWGVPPGVRIKALRKRYLLHRHPGVQTRAGARQGTTSSIFTRPSGK